MYIPISYRDSNTGEECKMFTTPLTAHDNITIPLTKYIVGHLSERKLVESHTRWVWVDNVL